MLHHIEHSLIEVLKLIPFLFISFILMELIEHKLNNKSKLKKINKFGPLAGATLGIIPQCGFSALASNLYAARVITLGTLFSIYLSTSDEMLPILISNKTELSTILKIIFIKFLIALLIGIIVDIFYKKKNKIEIHDFCKDEHCHCEKGIIKSSLIHTLKISIFIFLVNILVSLIIDKEFIINFISNNKILSPLITSIIGLIPNCASSVIITELYIQKIIPFGSCISGLLAGSGVGVLILFKQNKHKLENITILIFLIIISSIFGIIFNLV